MGLKLAKVHRIPKARVVNREIELLSLCEGKKVLHLGCADRPFTRLRGQDHFHYRLSKVTNQLYGVDISAEGIEALKEMGYSNLYVGNVEELNKLNINQSFDIIIAGEVIEHLMNPGLFLSSVRTLMSKNTLLIITVPNAFSTKIVLFSFFMREKVHLGHHYWFSFRTIYQFLRDASLTCDEIYFYQYMVSKETAGLIPILIDRFFSFFTLLSPCLADGLIVCIKVNKES